MLDANLTAALRRMVGWPPIPKQEPPQTSTRLRIHHHVHHHAYSNVHVRRTSERKPIPQTSNGSHEAEGWEEYWDLDCFPRFLELPREIRDMVYEFAMDTMPTRFTIVSDQVLSKDVFWPGTLPSLCFASKQLQREGIAAWIRRTRFVLLHNSDAATVLMRYLKAVESFSDVRMLSFLNVRSYGSYYGNDIFILGSPPALAASCPGLHSLILEIDGRRLLTKDRSSQNQRKSSSRL